MGKASSSKKIRKVQAAGVSRAPGQRRNLGFPSLIIGIVLVGSVLVFFARDHRQSHDSAAPVVNQDHWHAAFGIDICGVFQPSPADAMPDANGIHTHSDGLIHIHPYVAAAAGENAKFKVFAEQIGLELSDGKFTLPNGKTYKNGDECTDEVDGKKVKSKGRVVMYVWPPQATDKTKPKKVTEDIGDIRFEQDGMAFVLAFEPKDAKPELPPSMPELAAPSDLDAPPDPGSTEFTTTVPGASSSSTLVAGETTTTAPTQTTEATTTTSEGD